MRPSADLGRERARALWRQTIARRGPDRGKTINRLTMPNSGGLAERVEELADASGFVPGAVSVTSPTGDLLFTVGLSTVGGADVVG